MSKKTVLVTRKIPEAGLSLLRKSAIVKICSEIDDTLPEREELIKGVKTADVIISLVTEKIDLEIMESNPKLLGISNYAVGYDNIDVKTATELGIPVTNTPGVLTDTTADLAWALLMAVARRIPAADKFARKKQFKTWSPNLMLGTDISTGGLKKQKTLGIIGYGKIGKAVHKRANGFDMKVIAHDPYQKGTIEKTFEYRELDDLLRESDFITIHVPMNEKTKHLIGEREFNLMKKTAFIINTARGPIIEEKELIKALSEGKIAGAGLDVYENEPDIPDELIKMENVVLLPHIGSASTDTRNEMAKLAASNATYLLNGKKCEFTVNPKVYESEAYENRLK